MGSLVESLNGILQNRVSNHHGHPVISEYILQYQMPGLNMEGLFLTLIFAVWRPLSHELSWCYVLLSFRKFQLPIGLDSIRRISPTAGGTSKKCFAKYHDWAGCLTGKSVFEFWVEPPLDLYASCYIFQADVDSLGYASRIFGHCWDAQEFGTSCF